jgi:hypothetical protein
MGRQIKTYPEIDPDMCEIVKKRCGKEQIRKLLIEHQPNAAKGE